MGSLLGALGGAAAAKLEQGQRENVAATRDAGHASTLASLKNTEAIYDGIIAVKKIAKEIDAQFDTTREWIAGVQDNVNDTRDEVRAGRNAAIQAAENTNTLLAMAKKGEDNHDDVAKAFNEMAGVVGEMRDQIIELKAEMAALRSQNQAK